MPKRLTKRTAPESPKPLPSRSKEVEEPETTLCTEPENVASKEKSYLMALCTECGIFRANSKADGLCLNCHKAAEGFEFDEEKKIFVKRRK
jgi:hypothetical protein